MIYSYFAVHITLTKKSITKFMYKKILKEKLKEIDKIITLQYKNENHIGVLSGLSGIALFQFYYSKYLDVDKHSDMGAEILTTCIDRINDGYSYPTYCTGMAGMGWVLDHLKQEGFIDIDNDSLLQETDKYLYSTMVLDMKNEKYDFLHGGIGYAFYFLNRYRNTKSKELKDKYKKIILEFIASLNDLSLKDGENNLKWLSELNNDAKERAYNLSLAHGMSSIVGILTKLYQYDDFEANTRTMLIKSINYIMTFKNENEEAFCLFPSSISEKKEVNNLSRLAWCYGDLGIGIKLWQASKVLNDKKLANEAINILKHAAKRTTPEKSLVRDAGICHGSFGNAQIFFRLYKDTREEVFKEATDFWIQEGIKMAIHKDGYAGYKQWKGIHNIGWSNEIILLEGVAGIGLTIIDYLASFDSNWDECLLIS